MIYGSVCSGKAASVAWHPLGWRAAFLSEIEPFPRAVLAHHYPGVPLHGDFTTIEAGDCAVTDNLPAKPAKRRITTTRDWILRGQLVPWMMQYAQWLAQQPGAELSVPGGRKRGRPTIAERQAMCNLTAHRKIQLPLVWMLEQRPDFVAYFEKMRADAVFLAKETMKQDLMLNIEARRIGLERAADVTYDSRTGERIYGPMLDVKEVRQYTEFVPTIAFPKQAPREDAAPRIVIHLGSKEAKALIERALEEPEVQDVEYEVLPPAESDVEEIP